MVPQSLFIFTVRLAVMLVWLTPQRLFSGMSGYIIVPISTLAQLFKSRIMDKDRDGPYMPPFDHENVWGGNGFLIDEVEN